MPSTVRIKPLSDDQVMQQLHAADELCDERAINLTPLRRQVLELVIRRARPVGAYELLDMLREAGRSSAPPTVYRALEFLLEAGLVHRLPAQNAYMACSHPHHHHHGLILSCRRCGQALELETPELFGLIEQHAGQQGFSVADDALEVSGICPFCRSDDDER
jgi:Fur family zinc uptake transcriptional regulator